MQHFNLNSRKYSLPVLALALACGLSLTGCQHSENQGAKPAEESANSQPMVSTPETQTQASRPAASKQDSLIVPGQRVGEITSKTSLADLERLFGKANVKVGDIPGAEGAMAPGATLFPNDPSKKLTLYWKEAKSKAQKANPHIGVVVIDSPNSPWHTEAGIKVGTTLKALEKLNGHPFTLSGFDWDYGGMVLSWGDQGKLREIFQTKGGLSLQLAPPVGFKGDYNAVTGDGTFSSDNPAMQKLNPEVTTIQVFLQ